MTAVVHTCGCPAGHLLHCHTALILLDGLILIAPRCMLPATCHCSCNTWLNMLMSGESGGPLSS